MSDYGLTYYDDNPPLHPYVESLPDVEKQKRLLVFSKRVFRPTGEEIKTFNKYLNAHPAEAAEAVTSANISALASMMSEQTHVQLSGSYVPSAKLVIIGATYSGPDSSAGRDYGYKYITPWVHLDEAKSKALMALL